MWPLLSFIMAFVVVMIILTPVLGVWSLVVGLILGWVIKKYVINPNDPLQPTYRERTHTKVKSVQKPPEIDGNEPQEEQTSEDDYVKDIDTKIGSFNASKVGIVICLVAVLPWPTPFYMLTRLGICVSAGLLAYQLYKAKPDDQQGLWVLLCGCAVLFNPIFPIYLHSQLVWMLLDILTALLFYKAGNKISEFKKTPVNNST